MKGGFPVSGELYVRTREKENRGNIQRVKRNQRLRNVT